MPFLFFLPFLQRALDIYPLDPLESFAWLDTLLSFMISPWNRCQNFFSRNSNRISYQKPWVKIDTDSISNTKFSEFFEFIFWYFEKEGNLLVPFYSPYASLIIWHLLGKPLVGYLTHVLHNLPLFSRHLLTKMNWIISS